MSSNNNCISLAEKCFTNIDLVTNICKFLNYQQEYQLLQVSRELKDIIINFVWKTKFIEVEILQVKRDFIVSDTIDTLTKKTYVFRPIIYQKIRTSNQHFKKNEMYTFLNLNANNIKRLQLIAEGWERLVKARFPLKEKLSNLTYIGFYWVTLANRDLETLAENCKELETLVLSECLHKKRRRLLIGQDIELQIIKSMQNLNRLIIRDHFDVCHEDHQFHTFSNIINILHELKLQHLTLNVAIMPDADTNNKNELNLCNFHSYKVLDIGPFKKLPDFVNFQTNFLPNFENLHNLCLRSVTITEEFLHILMKFCKKLTHLTFYYCYIKDFIALPQLQEIYFKCCTGLTYIKLKTILNEMHLNCFTSLDTKYSGDLEYFFISPSIKKFKFHEYDNKNIIKLLEFNRKNLKQLIEFYWHANYEDYKLKFLNNVPNLKILHIPDKQLNITDYFEMKNLQKVVINSALTITVTEFKELLMQENIRELSISSIFSCKANTDLNNLIAFQTKLLYLNLNWKIMEVMTDFLLDLLELNRQLYLKCNYVSSQRSITELIRYVKFPQRFKYVNICGINIDCLPIKNKCRETEHYIKFLLDIFYNYCPDYYLVLQ